MHYLEIDGETHHLLALGLETCLDIISNPRDPQHFHHLTELKQKDLFSGDLYTWANGGATGNIDGKGYWGDPDDPSLMKGIEEDSSNDLSDEVGWVAGDSYQMAVFISFAANTAIFFADKERIGPIRASFYPNLPAPR